MTAGNASGQNDAASMCIVTTPEKADRARADARWSGWCRGASAGRRAEHHGHRAGARDRGRAAQGGSAADATST